MYPKQNGTSFTRPLLALLLPNLVIGIFGGIVLAESSGESKEIAEYDAKYTGTSVREGDILVGNFHHAGTSNGSLLWPDAIVKCKISSRFSKAEREVILQAMKQIELQSCVKFQSKKTWDVDYVDIVRTNSAGCKSHLGRVGNAQQLYLQPHCIRKGIVMHELMHALGFYHEHCRPDRDKFLFLITENIRPEELLTNMKKRERSEVTDFGLPYDYESIMHYPLNASAKAEGLITMVATQPRAAGLDIGQRDRLSKTDVEKLRRLYKFDNTCKSALATMKEVGRTTTQKTPTTQPPGVKLIFCPPEEDIAPCKCESKFSSVKCDGPAVTQTVIEKLFLALRSASMMTSGEPLTFKFLSISGTSMGKLDLTPLLHSRIEELVMKSNPHLGKIYSSTSASNRSIHVTSMDLSNNVLTNEGLLDFFPHFSPALKKLSLKTNRIQGLRHSVAGTNGQVTEFLPGFSLLTQLEELILFYNPSSTTLHVGGGQFQRNSKLTYIDLIRFEGTLSGNAFMIDPPGEGRDTLLKIDLRWSSLRESSFNPVNGMKVLGNVRRPTQLDLTGGRNIDTFSQANFQDFLDANPRNEILAGELKIVCDGRMKWLKDGKDKYERRVVNDFCGNDVGETVFTSSLIDSVPDPSIDSVPDLFIDSVPYQSIDSVPDPSIDSVPDPSIHLPVQDFFAWWLKNFKWPLLVHSNK